MTCDRCDECRRDGAKFCIYCGENLMPSTESCCDISCAKGFKYCTVCGRRTEPEPIDTTNCCDECRRRGFRYCIYCGRPLCETSNVSQKDSFLTIGFYVGLVTAVFILLLGLFEYGVAIWGIPQVLPNIKDFTCSLILVIPQVYTFFEFSGTGAQVYYLLLIAAITVCMFWYIYKAIEPAKRFAKDTNDTEPIKNTAFFEVAVLFCALYFVEIVFSFILQIFGQNVGDLPERETWIWLFDLLEAPVWEELITRVLYLGVPVMILALVRKKTDRPAWKYLFGGFGIDRTALVFTFFSAFMFGAGHLTNWTVWKFFPTFLFGLIAGYLFCKYGVYATIVMHFLTDYIQAEQWLTGSSSSVITILILFLFMFACAPYVVVYLKKGIDALRTLLFSKGAS